MGLVNIIEGYTEWRTPEKNTYSAPAPPPPPPNRGQPSPALVLVPVTLLFCCLAAAQSLWVEVLWGKGNACLRHGVGPHVRAGEDSPPGLFLSLKHHWG